METRNRQMNSFVLLPVMGLIIKEGFLFGGS